MKGRISRFTTIAAAAIVAGACLFGFARPAQAQFGQAVAISELMKPEFINRDMVIFVEGLNLDDGQQVIVESMFENYRDDFDAGLERLRGRFEQLRDKLDTRDPDRVLKLVFAPFEQWRDERNQLRDQFLNNVKLVLSDRQLKGWDEFLRKLRRDKTLDRGILSGEHLNIFHVLQDMQLSEQQRLAIEPLLTQYETDLDQALRERNRAINDEDGVMLEAMQTQDADAMLKAMNHQIELRIAVRDINDHYVNVVAEALPETLGAEFREKAMTRAYPRIYRRSSAEKLFEAALALDLPKEVRQNVNEVYGNYRTAIEDFNQRLLDMVRAQEPKNQRQRAEAASARMENKPYSRHPNPTAVEFRKRDDIVREHVDLLKWAVGEERFAQLPGADRWVRKTPEEREALHSQAGENNAGPGRRQMRDLSAGGSRPAPGGKGQGPKSDNPDIPDE